MNDEASEAFTEWKEIYTLDNRTLREMFMFGFYMNGEKVQTIGISVLRIQAIDRWLDEEVDSEYKAQPMAQDWARISKVSEELGEAIQAFIGLTGQNPRKRKTHTLEEVIEELADTALTAILAMQHFYKDDSSVAITLGRKIREIYERMPKDYQT